MLAACEPCGGPKQTVGTGVTGDQAKVVSLPQSMRRRFVLRGQEIPVEYRDLEIDLSAEAGDGILYKNKGISRLELVRGGSITRVGEEWRIRFDDPRMMTLLLTMGQVGDVAPRAGVMEVSRPGSTAWRGDVTLEPI